VEQVHQAVAKRTFVHRALGPPGPGGARRHRPGGVRRPARRRLHRRGRHRTDRVDVGREDRQTGSTRSTNLALSALNAAIGDGLADHGDPLAIRMAVRDAGRDIAPLARGARRDVPSCHAKVAVFVHGLGETEHSWWPARDAVDHVSYGDALREELGYTPVYLRYNSGRHISDNGRELSGVLRHLTAAWPAPVDELLLVGHSMGA